LRTSTFSAFDDSDSGADDDGMRLTDDDSGGAVGCGGRGDDDDDDDDDEDSGAFEDDDDDDDDDDDADVEDDDDDDERRGDYINANYIDGEWNDASRAYIAAQGPKEGTIGDFWRMVWESDVRVVIMLTREVEANRVKYVVVCSDVCVYVRVTPTLFLSLL
jgi:hypothetical protein